MSKLQKVHHYTRSKAIGYTQYEALHVTQNGSTGYSGPYKEYDLIKKNRIHISINILTVQT